MHAESYRLVQDFVEEYGLKHARVADIGSADVNGTYRPLFDGGYLGVDTHHGPNVDVVMGSVAWNRLQDFDAAICGQVLEHVHDRVGLLKDVRRILRHGGLLCVVAPGRGRRHDYPIWTGNLTLEHMRTAVEAAGFTVLRCTQDRTAELQDVCCVARTP